MPEPIKPPPKKVALLIETSRGYGRQMLQGIVKYARLHGPWGFYVTPGDFKQALPQMQQWGGTGIIARVENQQVEKAILAARLPTILLDRSAEQLAPGHPLCGFSEVSSDSVAAARIAAEHLIDRGFQKFAYVGINNRIWSNLREQGFCQAIAESGYSVKVYKPPQNRKHRQWEREQPHLTEWLRTLPRPLGLMACNDDRGREVLEACRVAQIDVPEEIAVIGVDNDELLCELADPPLSSVALDAEATGYRTAAFLDELMRKAELKPRHLKAAPLNVVTRRSSNIFAFKDPDLAAAFRFIHDHATCGIGVDEIVEHVAISRRKLEILFQEVLGRTPHAEVHRIRMERAKQFLVESDLPIPKIAEAVGYGTPSYFIQVFRETHGITPAKFRRDLMEGQSDGSRSEPRQ